MPFIVTDIHDPEALAATCRRLGLDPPHEGGAWLGGAAAAGWVVCLPGLHAPVVCDTLTGLIAYDPRDNGHGPYGRIMSFVHRYYSVRAHLRGHACRRVGVGAAGEKRAPRNCKAAAPVHA
jgi:hypothetical protein